MNRQELIDAIAAETESSKAVVTRFLDSFINQVQRRVAEGDSVKISGFGVFGKSKIAARLGRNPKTGETIAIPAFVRPRFSPGATFKALVKGE